MAPMFGPRRPLFPHGWQVVGHIAKYGDRMIGFCHVKNDSAVLERRSTDSDNLLGRLVAGLKQCI